MAGVFTPWRSANATNWALIYFFADYLDRLKEVVGKMLTRHIQSSVSHLWSSHHEQHKTKENSYPIQQCIQKQLSESARIPVFKDYYPIQQKIIHVIDEQVKFQHVFIVSLLSC